MMQLVRQEIPKTKYSNFLVDTIGILRMHGELCVSDNVELKGEIMNEVHRSSHTVHPGDTKMYQDLRSHYWWNRMKKDVASYGRKCKICQ